MDFNDSCGKFREELCEIEMGILSLTGDPLKLSANHWEKNGATVKKVEEMLDRRYYLLSRMFALHCSDAEVRRLEHVNRYLYSLTCDLFTRTGIMYRNILDLSANPKDDDLTVAGTLKYWGDSAQDVLHLEDDTFYGSDFTRMILINAALHRDVKGDLAIISCDPMWRPGCGHKSSMSDEELGIANFLDDGNIWAEDWFRHPKLNKICICYAANVIVANHHYTIPDLLRMNSFEVKVDVTVQQIREQDGSRLWWWGKSSVREFVDKFLHEAQSRPFGETIGEFVWRRAMEYFDIQENEGSDCEIPRDKSRTDIISELPDCRNDDSLVEEFLMALRKRVLE